MGGNGQALNGVTLVWPPPEGREAESQGAWEGWSRAQLPHWLGCPVPALGCLPRAPPLPAASGRPRGLVNKAHLGGLAPQCQGPAHHAASIRLGKTVNLGLTAA